MTDIMATFGTKVFNDAVMRERLSESTYKELNNTIRNGEYLNNDIAEEVANAMMQWAIENGATHFTHWFHPLSGATAEKHESFVSPRPAAVRLSLSFLPSIWSRVKRMPHPSLPAVCVIHLKRAVTQPGIPLPMRLSKTISYAFRLFSARTAVKHWIIKHRFCALWKLLTRRQCVF